MAESHGQRTVTVSPGIVVKEMKEFFDAHKLCFESNVLLQTVTAVGIIATGCHVSYRAS